MAVPAERNAMGGVVDLLGEPLPATAVTHIGVKVGDVLAQLVNTAAEGQNQQGVEGREGITLAHAKEGARGELLLVEPFTVGARRHQKVLKVLSATLETPDGQPAIGGL